jgi:hypothetical protein
MAIVLADVGADIILKAYFNNSWAAGGKNLTLKLYTNNYTPLDTSVAGSFTEASGGGYAAKTLSNGSWTVTVGNDPSDAVYAQQTFTFTGELSGAASVYGYFVVDADGVLLLAEKFAYSFTPRYNGETLKVTPRFQLSKGTPTA